MVTHGSSTPAVLRRAFKMSCPRCFECASSVERSRPSITKDQVGRRRRCLYCGKEFPTYERVDLVAYALENQLPPPPTWDDFDKYFHEAWGHAKAGDPYVKDDWLAWKAIVDALKRVDPGTPHPR